MKLYKFFLVLFFFNTENAFSKDVLYKCKYNPTFIKYNNYSKVEPFSFVRVQSKSIFFLKFEKNTESLNVQSVVNVPGMTSNVANMECKNEKNIFLCIDKSISSPYWDFLMFDGFSLNGRQGKSDEKDISIEIAKQITAADFSCEVV